MAQPPSDDGTTVRADGEGRERRPLDVGAQVGPYRIEKLLGAGGMGEVYLANDTRLGRQVALKTVTERLAEDPLARTRALREARAVARLSHPNIASVHDVIDHDGSAIIVMEFVEGRSLRARLRDGAMPVAEAVPIAAQLADGLDYAHQQGILHCDVKPANVQLTSAGRVKLLDFGVARRIASAAATTTTAQFDGLAVAGTPAYMSPEQRSGLPLDQRSDVFALGIVLSEMVYGLRLTGAGATSSLASSDFPEPPAGSTVPAALRSVISRATAPDPNRRYQSVAEFRDALAPIGAPRSTTATIERLLRSLRKPVPASIIAVAVAILAGIYFLLPSDGPIILGAEGERFYAAGTLALQEGAYAQAAASLESAVNADRSSAMAWARLGEARLELDREGEATAAALEASTLMRQRRRLSTERRLALEAAIAMVNRKYADAIAAYSSLASFGPPTGASLVDLGRAYEASGDSKQALAQYSAAARLDASNPAPFLRIGTIEGRLNRIPEATAAFDSAEKLYAISRRPEGSASVEYQRAVVLQRTGKPAEAYDRLRSALQLAEVAGNKSLRATILFKLSSVEGDRGNTHSAEAFAQQALTAGEGLDALLAFGLVDVANIYLPGNTARAAGYLNDALARARKAGAHRAEARASLALSGIEISLGHFERGEALSRTALEYYQKVGFKSLASAAWTNVTLAQESRGDLAGAQATYETLLREAQAGKNDSDAAQAHHSLAGVLLRRERYREAEAHSADALRLYTEQSRPYDVVFAILRRVGILGRLGRFDEAKNLLNDMFRTGAPSGSPDPSYVAPRGLVRAELALEQQRVSEALRVAKETAAAAKDDPTQLAEIEVVFARAAARAAQTAQAAAALRRADAAQAIAPDAIVAVKADVARVEVMVFGGQFAEALKNAERLASDAEKSERWETAWTSAQTAARAALGLRDAARAQRNRDRADSALARLEGFIASDDLPAFRARLAGWRSSWNR